MRRILEEVDRHHYTENASFAIKLALDEALINAIKHGNQLDPAKRVQIEASVTPEEAEIIIQDHGVGFEREAVPDPTLEENLEKSGGRGILLIEAYMTSAQWTDRGRRLRMVRRNNDLTTGSEDAGS
jgi:serine/threonine-protein kinase RsbW